MGICLIVKNGGGVDTSTATVTANKILSGYTIYSNDNKITGTMKLVGNQNKVDTKWGTADSDYYKTWCGVTNWIWEGWHDGTSGFNVGTLTEHTWDCDIPDASWCLSGYTYWKNGDKITGTMTNRGTKTWSIGANGTQTIESGWHDGNGYVNQSIPVDTGEWGPNPTTTDSQLCWQGWYYSANRWCWGNGNLVAGNIRSGVSIFGVWGTCSTNLYLIRNGQLQYPVEYTNSGVTETMPSGAKGHYDSSLGAYVMYATSWSTGRNSYKAATFPRFTGLSYPKINSATSQTGVIHMEYMLPEPVAWADSGGPSIAVTYNNWGAWNLTNGPRVPKANTRVHAWVMILGNVSSISSSGATVWIDYGRAAYGPSKIEKKTYVYNVWIDTTASLSN